MECIQFHPTGMVWPPSVRGILVTEGVRGDGGTLKNTEGVRFMFNYIPEFFKSETADNEKEADAWYEDKKNNRRTPDLLPRDEVARAINSEVKAGRGSPHGGVLLDIAIAPARRLHPEAAAVHVPPVQGAGGRGHHQGGDGGRAHLPLHHGRRARGGRHRGHPGARPLRGGRGGGRAARGQPARRQLALRSRGLRPAGRARRRRVRAGAQGGAGAGRRPGRRGGARAARALRQQRQREPLRHSRRSPGVHADPRRHHPDRGRAAEGSRGDRGAPAAPRPREGRGRPRLQSRPGTSRWTSTPCSPSPRR